MDQDRFEEEWQELKEQRLTLFEEVQRLRYALGLLPQEPSIKALLKEKDNLKQELPTLKLQAEVCKEDIKRRQRTLKRRRRAIGDKRLQSQLIAWLKDRRDRLGILEELNAPSVMIQGARRLVFELEAPIEEVEKYFRELDAQSELELQSINGSVGEILSRIEEIRAHYQQTKKCLEEAVRAAEEQGRECYRTGVEWATQDREHLEWTLEHEPCLKSDIVRRYRIRFPTDSLSDLFPSPCKPNPQHCIGKKRNKLGSQPTEPPAAIKTTASSLPEWKFWITFNPSHPGIELSPDKAGFIQELKSALYAASYPNLSAELVYDKLMAVTNLSINQRQTLKKLNKEKNLVGWKIIRVGKKHRLFLDVDEQRRCIRFIPLPRKSAYSGH